MRLYKPFFFLVLFSAVGCASLGVEKLNSLDAAVDQGPLSVAELCHKQKLSGACALSGETVAGLRTLATLQGLSGDQEARIVVLAPMGKGLRYYLQEKDKVRRLEYSSRSGPGLSQELHHLEVFGLKPATEYTLFTVGPNADLWDRRRFKTFAAKKKRPRFAVVSCMDDALSDVQKQIWPELLKQEPDFILMIGDNTYADWTKGKSRPVTSVEQLWVRYAETRERLAIFSAEKLVPTVATWDDHDFGRNDGDRTFPLKNEALTAFFAFYPQARPGPGFRNGPGVSSWWTVYGLNLALLDDRSFRSPNRMDLPDQTHFGMDQEKWLQAGLKEAKSPVFVISGDQFFGGYHPFESYEGSHPKSFKEQLNVWRSSSRVPLVFVSGDRHLSEILKVPAEHLGYPTFEITSSGVHAKVFPEAFKKAPSPMQLAGVAGEYNYSIIEVMDARTHRLHLDVRSFGLGQKLLYQKSLMVKR